VSGFDLAVRTSAAAAAWLLLPTGCDSDPGAESRQAEQERAAAETAEPEPPPEAPALDSLEEPAARSAQVAVPEWRQGRYEWEVEQLPAIFGTSETVTQLLLGEDPAEGVMLTFYGAELGPGEYEVLPATDDTRAEHAGQDSGVFIVTVGKPGENDMRSLSGTVTIERADQDVIVGSLEIEAKALVRRSAAAVRGRFHARHDSYMDALLSHEAAIREQLKRR